MPKKTDNTIKGVVIEALDQLLKGAETNRPGLKDA